VRKRTQVTIIAYMHRLIELDLSPNKNMSIRSSIDT